MSTAVSPEVLKRTQEELGKYIKKPPLTDKLLNKPPFRFLHDIVNAIICETGFLSGLFSDEELSSQNIKDKEAKVAFLQKCIDATILATGENLAVRPSKIVAGHEADKTNEWLQALARAVAQNIDSSTAVQQVLSGVKPEKNRKSDKEKSDKKQDRGKKEAAAKNRGIRGNGSNSTKDPKQAKDPKPTKNTKLSQNPKVSKDPKSDRAPQVIKDPIITKGPTSSSESRPTQDPQNTRELRLGNESGNATKGKSSPKPSQDKGSPVKSSKSKDDKERSSRKNKSKEKEEGKSSSKSKERRSKEGKDDKEKRKPKTSSPERMKSSKSRPTSRMGQVKESGKENSPPQKITEGEEMILNQNAAVEEMESATRLDSARPPSTQIGLNTAAEDGLMVPAEPESLVQVVSGVQENKSGEGGEPPVISDTLVGENNNIDPAILKAMAPDHDQLQGGNGQLVPPNLEPPDSGVGSLDSPKHSPKERENLPMVATPKPGPQPLRAMEQFSEGALPTSPPLTQPPTHDNEEHPSGETYVRPRTGRRSARPPSARPAPPRVRERREIPKEELQRPATSKPVANVILSSNVADNDDDDNFMVEESKPTVTMEDESLPLDAVASSGAAAAAIAAGEDGEGAGLLVAQILETKKELEDGRRNAFSPETPGHRRVPIEQSLLSDTNRKKERELIQKDVQKLSGSIQSITRSVNPLAKMLDYLQEDLDSMQKELEMWRSENKQLTQTLRREQSLTEQALEPLRSQLLELETAVQEQRDKLSTIKSNILRNSEKISRLMAGINLNI
ncbi:uncharacterized protein IFT54 isoform X2 [Panulirus ornatus]|uniref:uncharacterized protein IFT54 isoform X2 n=1 Tax=Panulirus ornatus TaxID=150431 RepID=UPI003A83DCA0